jgi:CubicO group peptidase (beta-lactamase class C family)
MSTTARLVFAVFIFLTHAVFSAIKPNSIEDILPAYREYVEKAAKEWNSPGTSVAIFANGKVFFINYGVSKVGSSERITEDSVCCILSCTKIVTVILLQKLVDEGKISLEDRVIDHIPWFKLQNEKATAEVKVKHLISHCIGMPAFWGDTLTHFDFSADEIIKGMSVTPLKYPVGKKYGYQNLFVGIAGMLIEKVTGRSLKELMPEYIFKQLDMPRSSVGPHYSGNWSGILERIVQFFKRDPRHVSIAPGHNVVNGKVVVTDSKYHYIFNGTSGVNSTTSDYIKLVACLANSGVIEFGPKKGERLFSVRAWDTMSSPQIIIGNVKDSNFQFPVHRMKKETFFYGNGMYGIEYGEGDKFVHIRSHMGAGTGWRTFWAVVPDHNVGIVIFSNLGSISTNMLPEALAYKFLDVLFGFPETDWSTDIKKKQMRIQKAYDNQYECYVLAPALKPAYLCGTYRNSLFGELKVVEKNGGVAVIYRGRCAPLIPVGGPVFTVQSHDLTINYGDDERCSIYFSSDDRGSISGVHMSLIKDGSDLFERVS